jgi:uracil-DNA glycosylase
MAGTGYPHSNISEDIRQWMEFISTCRDEACLVPNRHPFYPVPEQPPFYYGPRPCMPVVPTRLATNKVMIIGEYPNTRFGTVRTATGWREQFVPVGDINEPFEGGQYYDGYSIRDYPTFASLELSYLKPLGLDINKDIWLTNINKCHLLRPSHIETYEKLGWNTPPTRDSYDTDDDYLAIAAVCVRRHLVRELELCQPKLIITLGEKAYRMIHSSDDFQQPAPDTTNYRSMTGTVLLANVKTQSFDKRNAVFSIFNVVHLFHPSLFIRTEDTAPLQKHTTQDIPAVRGFLQSIGLV